MQTNSSTVKITRTKKFAIEKQKQQYKGKTWERVCNKRQLEKSATAY